MTRTFCVYAGPVAADRSRACGHPGRGGVVRHLAECQTCELWEPRPGAAPAPAAFGPCALRGEELTGAARQARGLSHGKRWALCLHEEKPLGEVTCPCAGCGPKCPEYRPDAHSTGTVT